jgi:hypothetical protein
MSVSALTTPQVINFSQDRLQALLYLPGTRHKDLTLGYIGSLSAASANANDKMAFLKAAQARLFSLGAQEIIGPVDGDTWHRYRLPLTGSLGLTFLEPDYPGFTDNDFFASGMPVIATYRTSLVNDLSVAMEKLTEPETIDQKALGQAGVKIRCLQLQEFETELTVLHRFSLAAFQHNFLYSDIDLASFQGLYRPLKRFMREDLVLIAEADDGQVLGVVLAVPDPANQPTIIIKTLARHPLAPRGLGRYLFYEVLARAHQLGYSRALCALMKDDNFSAFLPDQLEGKVIRKFALFGCTK